MTNPDSNELRVLVLAPTGRDATLAASVLESSGIRTLACASLERLHAEIAEGAGAVLLTEEALTGGTLSELADIFRNQRPWSDLPLLVFTGGHNRRETLPNAVQWLAELANVTLLDRPTRKVTLVSTVRAALRARRRQYEVRDLLARLEENVRERDQFLAILSHELRNPLAAILFAAEGLDKASAAAIPRGVAVIERQTRLLSRLVDDLLDVARITTGKIVLVRSTCDVRDLVERCLQTFVERASEQNKTISLESGDTFSVDGDPFRLEQVVNNLITNAFKYTPAGGEITISLSRDEDSGEIRIADSGMGIDPGILPRIFDPFTQAENAIDRSQGGLGLGLTLVKNLVALHGGSVKAASPGSGMGSTFVVRLPRSDPQVALIAETDAASGPMPGRRVLIVEDNADLRDGLKCLLEEAGHQVFASADGEDGVESARIHRPDVLLVDIGLPKLDGYGVARRVRLELNDSVLLVAISGYGSLEDRRRAFEAGFDGHLTKPVSFHAVLDLLSGRNPGGALRPADA